MEQVKIYANRREVGIMLQAVKCLTKVKRKFPKEGDFALEELHELSAKLGEFWEVLKEDGKIEQQRVKDSGRF